MRKLNIMLFREIRKSKGQFLAAAVVVFAGITMFVAVYMSYLNLKSSLEKFYDDYRFLHYYAEATHISPSVVRKVRKIKGVSEAYGRISQDVSADMGVDRRVTVRLLSLPEYERPPINRLLVVSGRYIGSNPSDSCLVGEKFASFYKIRPGDKLKTIINLRTQEFRVAGIVSSPEFIYAMKSATAFTPSAEDFGIVYIQESMARSILGYGDTYNEVHVRFFAGADNDAAIDKIEYLLKPYGFIRGVQRKDQLSHSMVDGEIKQLEEMAWMFPAIFLTVAALIIYIMQKRVINHQRTQIGVMKAFGYRDYRILGHYLLYSLLVAVVGTIPAIWVGSWLGTQMTTLYNELFNIPVLEAKLDLEILMIAILISSAFCLLAGFQSTKKVLSIQPAQAMRPEAPKMGRRILLERWRTFWMQLSFGWKMSIRNLFRSSQRTSFTILGMTFAVMFLLITLFFFDSIDYVFTQHFFMMQKQDYKVIFSKTVDYYDALELRTINGVRKVEPIMEIPVEIQNGWMKKESIVVGLPQGSDLTCLIGSQRQPVVLPKGGIMLAEPIADKLGVKAGDTVSMKILIGDLKEKRVKVAGTVKQYAGFNCFMNLHALGSLLEEGDFATGALLTIDKGDSRQVIRDLYKQPGVETVEGRLKKYESFMELMEFNNLFFGMMILFGVLMGFAIVFNTTVINIMERNRELASLRVLGYTRKETESIIFRENMLMGLVSLAPGIMLGRIICDLLAKQFSTDHLFAFEVVIYPRSFILTIASVFLYIVLAQWANRKSIYGLDMVEVLKNREG